MSQPTTKVTLADVARLAGVGVGTASRALSGSARVAPETRAKVLEVADRLHYVVSPDAASLASGRTGRVALVVPHLSRWFFGEVAEGIHAGLRGADLDLLLYPVGAVQERAEFFERLPARRKVDAVIVVAFQVLEAERRRLELMGVHIVAAGGQSAAYPYVRIDDYVAGRQAMDHLLFLGHRRIAMLEARDPDQPDLDPPRSDAYVEALRENGIEVDPELVVVGDWGGEQGAQGMSRLLSLRTPPTAVYAHSDEVALGAVRTIRRAGLDVPRDISVIGIDDHPLAALTDLTTVRQPAHEQGRRAAEMLIGLLRGDPGVDESVTLPTELVVRGSTAPPRG
ncbi:MAG: LacI family DNA-binding transcriptional regulator [Actinobacteria bacterium]|nr:LacI family DNA-binding transcriptional regulator [Actinomycetota bacterium]